MNSTLSPLMFKETIVFFPQITGAFCLNCGSVASEILRLCAFIRQQSWKWLPALSTAQAVIFS